MADEDSGLRLLKLEIDVSQSFTRLEHAASMLSARYGKDYPVVLNAESAIHNFKERSPRDRDERWYEERQPEIQAALKSIEHCAFTEAKLTDAKSRISALYKRARVVAEEDQRHNLVDNLEWADHIIYDLCSKQVGKFPPEAVADADNAEAFEEARTMLARLEQFMQNPHAIEPLADEESKSLKQKLNEVYDAFFGTNKSVQLVIVYEREHDPLGSIFLSYILARIEDAAGKHLDEVHDWGSSAGAELDSAWAHLRTLLDALNDGKVFERHVDKNANGGRAKARVIFKLAQELCRAKSIEEGAKLAVELEKDVLVLVDAALQKYEKWRKARYNTNLAEIRQNLDRERHSLRQGLGPVKAETRESWAKLDTSRADVASRYGAEFVWVAHATELLTDFSSADKSDRDHSWWQAYCDKMLQAERALARCAFTTAKLVDLNSRLQKLRARAENQTAPAPGPVQDRIRSGEILSHKLLKCPIDVFPREEARKPVSAVLFDKVLEAVGELEGGHSVEHSSNALRVEFTRLYDQLFGKGKEEQAVLESEHLHHPFGRIMLRVALDDIEAAAHTHNLQLNPFGRSIIEMLDKSWARLHVVFDEGSSRPMMTLMTALTGSLEWRTRVAREVVDLSSAVRHATPETITLHATRLSDQAKELFISFFGVDSAWAKALFESRLAEIRNRQTASAELIDE